MVATDDETGIDRNEVLGDALTGGRDGGESAFPHIAAAALTFDGVDLSGELPNDGSGDAGVDRACLTGEVFVLVLEPAGPGATPGTGEMGSSSSSSPASDWLSSPSSSSSSSFICGDVGVLILGYEY